MRVRPPPPPRLADSPAARLLLEKRPSASPLRAGRRRARSRGAQGAAVRNAAPGSAHRPRTPRPAARLVLGPRLVAVGVGQPLGHLGDKLRGAARAQAWRPAGGQAGLALPRRLAAVRGRAREAAALLRRCRGGELLLRHRRWRVWVLQRTLPRPGGRSLGRGGGWQCAGGLQTTRKQGLLRQAAWLASSPHIANASALARKSRAYDNTTRFPGQSGGHHRRPCAETRTCVIASHRVLNALG